MNIENLREKLSPIDSAFPLPEELKVAPKEKKSAPNSYGFTIVAACMVAVLLIGTGILTANIGVIDWENITAEYPPGIEYLVDPEQSASEETENVGYSEFQKAILRLKKEQDERYDGEGRIAGASPKNNGGIIEDTGEAAPPGFGAKTASPSLYGKTNTQVSGIDEADMIKNDGQYLYCLTGNKVKIVSALPASSMVLMSTIDLGTSVSHPEMYIDGSSLIITYSGSGIFDRSTGYSSTATKAVVYDIADRTNPKQVKTFSQEGSPVSSRLLNGRLYLVSNSYVNLNFEMIGGKIPMFEVLPMVNEDGGTRLVGEDRCFVLPETETAKYLLVTSIDIAGATGQTQTLAVLGSDGQMYMNGSGIFIASVSYDGSYHAKTNIYKFAISSDGSVTKGVAGAVDGTALNQFSMDEHNGYFRIATTENDNSGSENIITVLNGELKVIGKIGGLARGETIKSCRFIGNTAYMVTFRQTDPLFVIDLSNPFAPEVKGQLKIPGFSEYLHPWDETHLIGIGPDGNDAGTNRNTKISLFDVSNPGSPKEVSKLVIKNAESYVGQNHKVFTRYGSGNIFGIAFREYGDVAYAYSYKLFMVQDAQVKNRNTFDIPNDGAADDSDTRGTYIDSVWYVCYGAGISAFAINGGEKLGEVKY